MTKNQTINYGTQGSSFHCLLWAMCYIMEKMRARGMKSCVVGQIHDSIIADVVPEERDDYIDICTRTIEKKLQRAWPWLIVPMVAEVEVCPVGASWDEKAPAIKRAGDVEVGGWKSSTSAERPNSKDNRTKREKVIA